MKRILIVLLALTMLFTLFAACADPAEVDPPTDDVVTPPTDDTAAQDDPPETDAELPPAGPDTWLVPERTTIRIVTNHAPGWAWPDDWSFFDWMEEYTNIEVEWIVLSGSSAELNEQFSLMMAAGDMPDAFLGNGPWGTQPNLLLYGDMGVFIPVQDLMASHAPNFMRRAPLANPDLMDIITAPSGNIYGFPIVHPVDGHFVYASTVINSVWLENLGLDMPTTIEELEQVLIAFRDDDPNQNGLQDEIPLSFLFDDWGAALHSFWFAPFGMALDTNFRMVENGQVVFQAAQEPFRDAARWLASLYAQGLVDREVFTYDQTSYRARAGQDPVVFGVWTSWSPWDDAGAQGQTYFTQQLAPLQGPGGAHTLWNQNVGMVFGSFVITNAASDPELLTRWVDVFYSSLEMGMRATRGPGPNPEQHWYLTDDDLIAFVTPVPDQYIRGQNEHPFAPSLFGFEFFDRQAPADPPNPKVDFISDTLINYAGNFFDGTWMRFPLTYMTPEESSEIEFIEADLLPFARRMLARWIANEGDVDAEWDQFLIDLDAYGLQEWLAIMQGVLDRS